MSDSERLRDLLLNIDNAIYGKQYHFEEESGLWYSRKTGLYLSLDDTIKEICGILFETLE